MVGINGGQQIVPSTINASHSASLACMSELRGRDPACDCGVVPTAWLGQLWLEACAVRHQLSYWSKGTTAGQKQTRSLLVWLLYWT